MFILVWQFCGPIDLIQMQNSKKLQAMCEKIPAIFAPVSNYFSPPPLCFIPWARDLY